MHIYIYNMWATTTATKARFLFIWLFECISLNLLSNNKFVQRILFFTKHEMSKMQIVNKTIYQRNNKMVQRFLFIIFIYLRAIEQNLWIKYKLLQKPLKTKLFLLRKPSHTCLSTQNKGIVCFRFSLTTAATVRTLLALSLSPAKLSLKACCCSANGSRRRLQSCQLSFELRCVRLSETFVVASSAGSVIRAEPATPARLKTFCSTNGDRKAPLKPHVTRKQIEESTNDNRQNCVKITITWEC